MTTVRQDLEAALEEAAVWTDAEGNKHWCSGIGLTVNIKRMECRVKCLPARAAIDRARAETEESQSHRREDLLVALDELFACDLRSIPPDEWAAARKAFEEAQSELQCPDGCDTSCRCYQEGTEAQREPAGRGTP